MTIKTITGLVIYGSLLLLGLGFGYGFDRSDLEWFDPIAADVTGWVTRDEFICGEGTIVTRADLSVVGHPQRSSIYTGQMHFLLRNTVGCGLAEASGQDGTVVAEEG